MRPLCVWLMCVNSTTDRAPSCDPQNSRATALLLFNSLESHTGQHQQHTQTNNTNEQAPPISFEPLGGWVCSLDILIFQRGTAEKHEKRREGNRPDLGHLSGVGLDLEMLPRGRQWKHKNRREACPSLWVPLFVGWVWGYFPEGDQHRTKHKIKADRSGPLCLLFR